MNPTSPKNNNTISISKASEILGVSIDTLRRWDKSGRIHSSRLNGGTRFYSLKEIERVKKNLPIKISEAAKNLNISVSTLRRLERKTSLKARRNSGNKRIYSQTDLEHLAYSIHGKKQPAEVDSSVYSEVKSKKPSSNHALISHVRSDVHTHRGFKSVFTFASVAVATFMVLSYFAVTQGTVGAKLITDSFDKLFAREETDSVNETVLSKATLKTGGEVLAVTDEVQNESVYFSIPVVFNENITAPNVIYSVVAGTGVTITGDSQNPIINASPLELLLEAGTGINISGTTITNTGITSLAAGDGISVSGNTITNEGIITLVAGDGISVSGSTITATTPASGIIDSGTLIYLQTTTDNVTLGGTTELGKLGIDGDTDETQLLVQGNSTQTNNLVVFENSSGTDVFTVSNAGSITTGDIAPLSNDSYNIGASSLIFNDIYIDRICFDGGVDCISTSAAAGATSGFSDDGTVVRLTTSTDNIGIGTSAPSGKLQIAGDADEIQLVVTGNGTQTSNLLTLEQSAGTDVFTVTNAGVVTAAGGLTVSAGTVSLPSGQIDNAELANSTLTFAGDAGSSTTALGSTRTVAGGANGIDTVDNGSGTLTVNFDSTEVGTTTFGSGSGITWTFDSSAGLDSTLTFGAGSANITATNFTITGNNITTGTSDLQGNISDSTGTLTFADDVSITGSTTLTDTVTFNTNSVIFANDTNVTISGGEAGLTFDTNTLVIDSSSNLVGIGTTSPIAKLQVKGDVDIVQFLITGNSTQTTNLVTIEKSDGTDLFTVTNTGNVSVSDTFAVNSNTTLGDNSSDTVTFNAGISGAGISFTHSSFNTCTALETVGGVLTCGSGGSGGAWTDGTNVIYLTTSTDNVGIGTTAPTGKLQVSGDTDEIQLVVTGNGTQTSNLLTLEQSNGTDVFTVSNAGNVVISGSASAGTLTVGGDTIAEFAGTGLQVTGNTLSSTLGTSISNAELDNSTITFAGDSGSSASALGDTRTISGGTNGVDTSDNGAGTLLVNLDTTEIGTTTFGSGSGITWTFDAGATDPSITFGSNSTRFTSGTASFSNRLGIGTTSPTVALDVVGAGSFSTNLTVNGNTVLGDNSSDTVTFTAGISGAGISFGHASFGTCTALETVGGVLTCGSDDTGGAGVWVDGTNVIYLTTSTDNVGIGTTAPTGKLQVAGDTDEIQLVITGNGTQTSNLLTLEQSDGTDVFTVTNDGVVTAAGGLVVSAGTVSLPSGQIDNAELANSTITFSGDSGSSATALGATRTIAGGTNGVDTIDNGSGTSTINLDTTEIGTTTFGSGSGITWTFDAGATDPSITFGSNSTRFTSGTASFSNRLGIGTTSPTVALDVVGAGSFSTNLTVTGSATAGAVVVGGDTINEFAGDGLAVVGNALTSTLGTSVSNAELDNSTITFAGDSGSSASALGDTRTISGGTNGVDTSDNGAGTLLVNLDTTEIGTTTFGSGSGITWTFDAGATDPSITFGSNSTRFTSGTASFSNRLGIGTTSPTVALDVVGAGSFSTNLTVNGNTVLGDNSSDTVTFTAGISGAGISFGHASFGTCTALETVGGVLTCGSDATGTDSGWFDGGSSVYLITSSDNVGIGTTAPSVALDVVGDGAFSTNLTVTGSASAGTLTVGGDTIAEFAGTGLQVTGNTLSSTLGTSISNAELDNSTITFAGDSGSSTTALGATRTIAGGTNGVDTSDNGAGTLLVNLDTTEIGTTTFGSGSGIAWTFDAGATDPTIAFGSAQTIFTSGTASFSGNLGIGTTSPTNKLSITTTSAQTTDILGITDSGTGTTTDGVDGASITFTQADDSDSTDSNSGLNIALTSSSGDSGDILSAINIANITGNTATENAIRVGSGFDNDMYFEKGSNDLILRVAAPSGATRILTIPALGANADICTSEGNCLGGGGGGANTSLSNLTTTAINLALIPTSSDAIDIGTASTFWNDVYVDRICFDGGVDCISTSTGAGAASGFSDDGTVVRLTTSTDNVGIGTTAPSVKLDVVGAGSFSTNLTVNGNTTLGDNSSDTITFNAGISGAGISFGHSSFDTCTALETVGGALVCGVDTGASESGWFDGGSSVYLITSSDNVGIGTTAPANKLTILTTTAQTTDILGITDSGTGTTTTGVDGASIAFTQADDSDSADTNAGLNIAMTSSSSDADTLLGINVAAITGGPSQERAIQVGTGWDSILSYNNGTTIINGTGQVVSGQLTNSTITFAGDSGSSASALGDTRTISGGTNGVDTSDNGAGTLLVNLDTTEIGTTTFGSGSGITWTFDAGATDPSITFGSNSTRFTSGTASFSNRLGIGTTSPTVALDVVGAGSFSTNLTVTGSATAGAVVVGGDTINEFAGDGLAVVGNALTSTLGTSVSNAELDNSTITFAGDSGSSASALGDTRTISGGTNGVDTSDNGAGTLLVNLDTTEIGTTTFGSGSGITWTFDAGATDPSITFGSNSTRFTSGTASFSNRLGIGTTSPTVALDVVGAGSFSTNLTVNGNTVLGDNSSDTVTFTAGISGAGISFGHASFGTCTALETVGGVLTCGSDDTGGAGVWVDGTNVIYLTTSTDNVGIGTTAPTGKLQVAGDTDEIQLVITGNGTQTSNLLTLEQSDGTDVFTVTNDGVVTAAGGLVVSAGTVSLPSGQIDNAELANSTITFSGDSGSSATALGATRTIAGGTNGVDTIDNGSGTSTINLDTTEIGTTTFGSGSGITWTFDAGATDPSITFGSNSTRFTSGTASFSNRLGIGTTSPTVALDVVGAGSFSTNLTVTGSATAGAVVVGGDTINEFAGDGLAVVGNALTSTLGTSVSNAELDNSTITFAGDSGSSASALGDTRTISGGTNGVDTSDNGAGTLLVNLDTTEIGTTTFGSGSGITWTFDAGATDPSITFGSNSTRFTSGTASFSNRLGIGTTSPTVALDVVGAGSFSTNLTVTGSATAGAVVVGGDTINEFAGDGLAVVGNALTSTLGTSVSNAELDNSTITFAGDSGSSASALGDTRTISGGTNGVDTSDNGAGTLLVNLDTTEIGTTTFGSGSGITWTFDSSVGVDSTLAFGSGTINATTTTFTITGAVVVTGTSDLRGNISNSTGTLTLADDVSVTGNTTLGDGTNDTVTLNAATLTFANDTNVVISGGTSGLNFDTDTLSIDASSKRVGIGTTAPANRLTILTETAQGADIVGITDSGTGTTTSGVDGMSITFTQADDSDSADTNTLLNLVATSSSSDPDTLVGLNITSITGGSATENAIAVGTGWDSVLSYNGTAVINGSGQVVSGQLTNSTITFAGDSGSSTTALGATRTIAGGTNGVDTSDNGAGTLLVNLDTTEIGTTTFGSGSGITWTFDAGATDPTIAFGSAQTIFTSGTASFSNRLGIGTTAPTVALDVVGDGAFSTNLTVTGSASAGTLTVGGDTIAEFAGTGLQVTGNTLSSTLGTSISNAELDNSTITFAGDSGSSTTALGATRTIAGGTNGVDTSDNGAGTLLVNLDTTEIGTTTFGSGSGITWTFDAGATDPTIAFGSAQTIFTSGTASFSNRLGIGTTAPTVALDVVGDAVITGTTDLRGNVSNSVGTLTLADAVLVTGTFAVNGGSTLGDETTDAVTVNGVPTFNAASATFSVDTNVALSGGVAGLNFDTNTLSIDATNNRVGIGTTAPTVALDVVGAGSFSTNLTVTNSVSSATLNVSGNAAINGNTTLGDATNDTLTLNAIPTFNAASATFSVDTNVVLSGGVNGLSFDTSTLSIDATNDRVGIGTTAPSVALDVVGAGAFSTNLTVNGNTVLGDNSSDTVTFNAGISGAGVSFAHSSFDTCTALETFGGVLTCGIDDTNPGWTGSGTNVWVSTITHLVGIGTTAPTDKLDITTTTSGSTSLDGISINFTQSDDTDSADTNAGLNINITSSSSDPDKLLGINIAAITGGSATETGLNIGSGWDYSATFANNVGVGTTAPAQKLVVAAGNISIDQSQFLYLNGAADANWSIGKDSSHNINVRGASSGTRAFQVLDSANSDAVRFHLDFGTGVSYFNGGNVGIGTTNPSALLEVSGTVEINGNTTLGDNSSDTVTFTAAGVTFSTDTNVTLSGGVNGLSFDTSTLSIDASNNRVGIGTTAPSVALEVVGAGDFSTNLTVDGNTTLGDATNDTLTLNAIPTFNAASATFTVDTNVVLSGGVNGLSFDTNVLTIDSTNDRIGIGTTAPSEKLHLLTSSGYSTIRFDAATVQGQFWAGSSEATVNFGSRSNHAVNIATNNTTVMRISTGGLVGIGTTAPNAKLSIGNNVATGFLDNFSEYQLLLYDSGTANTSYGIGVKSNTMVFNSGGGAYSFDRQGSGSPPAMTISTAGRVGIATTAPAHKFDLNGDMRTNSSVYFTALTSAGGTLTDICLDTNNQAIETSGSSCAVSSSRFKKNISTLAPGQGTSIVNQLRAVSYEYIDGDTPHYGFIAEDVDQIDPTLVVYDNEGLPYSLDFNGIIAALVQNSQDLTLQVQDNDARITALESGSFDNGINIANITGSTATERAIQIGDGWDSNIYFDDTTTNIQVLNSGSVVFEDEDGTDLLSLSKTALSVNLDDTTSYSEKLCHSGIDGETGVVSVGDCSGTPGDYAEQYGASDASLSAGDVVMIDPNRPVEQIEHDNRKGSKAWIMKAVNSDNQRLLGVISTDPNDVIGQNFTATENARPVALNGRVPVKVNAEGGTINAGDFLTSSSVAGVATKATQAGIVLGRALESWSPLSNKTTIMMYVNTSYADPVLFANADDDAANLTSVTDEDDLTIFTLTSNPLSDPSVQKQLAINVNGDGSVEIPKLKLDNNAKIQSLDEQIALLNDKVATISGQIEGGRAITEQDWNSLITDIDILKTQQLTASISAVLGTATDSAQFQAFDEDGIATLSSLFVTGDSYLDNLGLTGNLSVGLLNINGGLLASDGASISTLAGPLKLQDNGINELDIMNGKVKINPDGSIVTTSSITTKELKIDASDSDSATAGSSAIPENGTSIDITTTAVKENSKIFITPKTRILTPLAVTEQTAGVGFKVELGQLQIIPVKFDWFIIN